MIELLISLEGITNKILLYKLFYYITKHNIFQYINSISSLYNIFYII